MRQAQKVPKVPYLYRQYPLIDEKAIGRDAKQAEWPRQPAPQGQEYQMQQTSGQDDADAEIK